MLTKCFFHVSTVSRLAHGMHKEFPFKSHLCCLWILKVEFSSVVDMVCQLYRWPLFDYIFFFLILCSLFSIKDRSHSIWCEKFAIWQITTENFFRQIPEPRICIHQNDNESRKIIKVKVGVAIKLCFIWVALQVMLYWYTSSCTIFR